MNAREAGGKPPIVDITNAKGPSRLPKFGSLELTRRYGEYGCILLVLGNVEQVPAAIGISMSIFFEKVNSLRADVPVEVHSLQNLSHESGRPWKLHVCHSLADLVAIARRSDNRLQMVQ